MAKSPSNPPAYPVESLREQCTALEAAIELVSVKPGKKPVHLLRTSTRRIEALLELLCQLEPDTPVLRGLGNRSRKLKKLLSELRKAAGKVRDLDVQRALVKDVVSGGAGKSVRAESKHLRSRLKTERDDEAEALLDELTGHARKLGPKLERLMKSLEPAENLEVSNVRLTKLIETWYAARTTGSSSMGPGMSVKALHGIRKAAKLARYMAEAGAAESLAAEFETTQQLGGEWHDALTLTATARQELGNRSALAGRFSRTEEKALEAFQQRIG